MKIVAELNYLRMAPRKVRLVADLIRGRQAPEAVEILRFASRRAAGPLSKLLRSAMVNAAHNFQVASPETLTISEVTVDGGPTLKRRRARARSRAFPIAKRTSHVRLVLTAAGRMVGRDRPPKAEIAVVRDAESSREVESPKVGAEREAFREKPKVATKPRQFVERMFRRKAI